MIELAEHEESMLNLLLRRMHNEGDFPALSSTISEINQIVSSESESANKLTKTILQDFALTNKLLRLVNTVSYGQFGGKINTISKAVVILGFDTVRNVAMTLILLEFLQNKSQATQLRDEVISSFFAGLLATQLTPNRSMGSGEEAMICGMFHNLGRLLVTFYFFDESQEISNLVAQGATETQASIQVLGTTYNALGIGIARSWSFPERLLSGMQKITADHIKKPRNELDQLAATVNLANELCSMAAGTPLPEKSKALKQLAERYQEALRVNEQQLGRALELGLNEMRARAALINLPTANSPLLKSIAQWSGHEIIEPEARAEDHDLEGITQLDAVAEANAPEVAERFDPESILGAGIQDVTNTLVSEFSLNDILQMVLETMYRGMRFHRILIFVRDARTNIMRARFGFGEGIDQLLPKFHFPVEFAPDVFHVALEKGVDIVIEDVSAENIAAKIPAWFHNATDAQCFLLLPVMVNNRAIGLFYADMQTANSLQIAPHQLSLLRTLRNQVVLAVKQKQMT